MKKPTENTGASIERAAIKRYCKKMLLYCGKYNAHAALVNIIAFIDTRTRRTASRKGGLGKR